MADKGGTDTHALDGLRRQLTDEQRASWLAAAGLVVLAVAAQQPWGFALASVVAATTLVRRPAFRALSRGDFTAAIWWTAVTAWSVALGVVAILPAAFPVVVLNLAGPLIAGALHLDVRAMRRLSAASVVVAITLATIGYRSPGAGAGDSVPEPVLHVLLVVYLAAHVVVLASNLWRVNRTQLAKIDEALAANDALHRATEELRDSRRRVISAADQERIRIERNIHDGTQQRLVALAVQLQLAAEQTRTGKPPAPERLDELHDESRLALTELRQLAQGIYPAALTEHGLCDALRIVAARSPGVVTVECDLDADLPTDEEAALYFICVEALQNAAKHAGDGASTHVRVGTVAGGTRVCVSDDGAGFDLEQHRLSRGLMNMSDRAAALGSRLVIDSEPGHGTRITVLVPSPDTESLV